MTESIQNYINQNTKAAPLAVFRILFGVLMCISLIRFWAYGWIEKLYLSPKFHFHYYSLDFVTVPGKWVYLLFIVCGIAALFVALGVQYRIAIISFFLSFTYIELMDKTTYLNHYYFISVLSFIMIWLPAHRYFSFDAARDQSLKAEYIPRWTIDVLKLMLAIVYIYAGLAKLNYDWMAKAMPLTIWLPTKMDLPLLGQLIHKQWLHFAFSWAGALYDLTIVFLLLWKRTRIFGFTLVIIFHVLTRVLFPIGMFPYIMICSSLIFFGAGFHEKILSYISSVFRISILKFQNGLKHYTPSSWIDKRAFLVISMFMCLQIIMPWRYLAYPGNVFWTEQGYRFSWRVMLMEKTGYANFKIVNGATGKRFYVQNDDFLTSFQEKQMATQPDMMLEYAHYLGDHFTSQGHEHVEVYVESYASLNGRKSQVYIDPTLNLMEVEDSFYHKAYIVPLNE